MATLTTNLNSFIIGAQEGRTGEPLHVFGLEVLVKLANADRNAAAAILHATVPPMSRPPLHRYSCEDEWFYVDGQRQQARKRKMTRNRQQGLRADNN